MRMRLVPDQHFSGIFKPWSAYIQLFQREDRLLQTGERLCLQSEKLQTGKHLQKCSGYRLEKGIAGGARVKKAGAKPEMGSPEQFYAEVIRQPSLAIEIPEYRKDDMEELRLIPLEYLYSLNSGILANA